MPKVYLTNQAIKDIKRLPKQEITKIKKGLSLLEKDWRIGKKLSGKLDTLYSLKTWPYRIVYLINKRLEVWVVHIMHRKDIYRKT